MTSAVERMAVSIAPDVPWAPGTVVFVLGTRPEIIKLAPVARALDRLAGVPVAVVHTGQHFDRNMSETFVAGCRLPAPVASLTVGGRPRMGQVAAATAQLVKLFAMARPGVVVVQGDTNSTLAGALAANGHMVPLVHGQAGLRSRDRRMPEEHNRVVVDHLADLLCAPTASNVDNLYAEGINRRGVRLTGNPVVEAVTEHLPPELDRLERLRRRRLAGVQYLLATIHRPENTDDPATLRTILHELASLADEGWPVVVPLHPRTARAARAAGCARLLTRLHILPPVDYPDFLTLAHDAVLLLSDSGGVQEEVTVLKRPLITIRRSTERPEAMSVFSQLVPPGPVISEVARKLLANIDEITPWLADTPSPFGDGHASERIATAVLEALPTWNYMPATGTRNR